MRITAGARRADVRVGRGAMTVSARGARICMVSLRGANQHAAWCSNYEFEDVVCGVDDVDLFSPTPAAGLRDAAMVLAPSRLAARAAPADAASEPGRRRRFALKKDYDLFVFVCMTPADLIYLSAVEGWKELQDEGLLHRRVLQRAGGRVRVPPEPPEGLRSRRPVLQRQRSGGREGGRAPVPPCAARCRRVPVQSVPEPAGPLPRRVQHGTPD